MERDEIEAAPGRSQNLVLILPQSMASVPRFLTGPLERIDPVTGALQLLVLTSDAETAIALAESVLGMTGPAGIELFPVTSARRAARLMKGRPILALAGTPGDVAELIEGSHIQLGGLLTVVLAWPDDLLEGDADTTKAVESVMGEVPKTAMRSVVVDRTSKPLDAFVERYLRRARRIGDDVPGSEHPPLAVQYLTVSSAARGAALRRLLDELDPPSFSVVAESPQESAAIERQLRGLGYDADRASSMTSGSVAPGTHTVILYGLPYNSERLALLADTGAVHVIALIRPREIDQLRRLTAGDVRPFTLSAAANLALERERAIRRELESVLQEGVKSREIGTIEPLLEAHDGVEIAAAALRLLEREREARIHAPVPHADRPPRPSGDRPPRPLGERPPRREFDRPPRRDAERRPGRDAGRDRERPRGRDDRDSRSDWRRGPPPPRKRPR